MRKIGYFLFVIMIALVSCTKYSMMPMHKKVIGTWSFEKVKNKPGLLKSNIDITKNYNDITFTFTENGEALYFDNKNGIRKSGRWQMELYSDTYYDEDGINTTNSEYILRFHFINVNGDTEYYDWRIGSITEKRLRASEHFGFERYNYVMQRK